MRFTYALAVLALSSYASASFSRADVPRCASGCVITSSSATQRDAGNIGEDRCGITPPDYTCYCRYPKFGDFYSQCLDQRSRCTDEEKTTALHVLEAGCASAQIAPNTTTSSSGNQAPDNGAGLLAPGAFAGIFGVALGTMLL